MGNQYYLSDEYEPRTPKGLQPKEFIPYDIFTTPAEEIRRIETYVHKGSANDGDKPIKR